MNVQWSCSSKQMPYCRAVDIQERVIKFKLGFEHSSTVCHFSCIVMNVIQWYQRGNYNFFHGGLEIGSNYCTGPWSTSFSYSPRQWHFPSHTNADPSALWLSMNDVKYELKQLLMLLLPQMKKIEFNKDVQQKLERPSSTYAKTRITDLTLPITGNWKYKFWKLTISWRSMTVG